MDEQVLSDMEALFSIIRRPHAKDPGTESAAVQTTIAIKDDVLLAGVANRASMVKV